MTYIDPGDSKGTRRQRSRTPAAAGQGDLLSGAIGAPPPEQPRTPSAGLQEKERVLAQHESGHEDRLEFIREKLRELYAERDAAFWRNPSAPRPYVTADDAAKVLEAASNLGYTDDDAPKPWFGSIFRKKGWHAVGWVPSLRAGNNNRMIRSWRWEAPMP